MHALRLALKAAAVCSSLFLVTAYIAYRSGLIHQMLARAESGELRASESEPGQVDVGTTAAPATSSQADSSALSREQPVVMSGSKSTAVSIGGPLIITANSLTSDSTFEQTRDVLLSKSSSPISTQLWIDSETTRNDQQREIQPRMNERVVMPSTKLTTIDWTPPTGATPRWIGVAPLRVGVEMLCEGLLIRPARTDKLAEPASFTADSTIALSSRGQDWLPPENQNWPENLVLITEMDGQPPTVHIPKTSSFFETDANTHDDPNEADNHGWASFSRLPPQLLKAIRDDESPESTTLTELRLPIPVIPKPSQWKPPSDANPTTPRYFSDPFENELFPDEAPQVQRPDTTPTPVGLRCTSKPRSSSDPESLFVRLASFDKRINEPSKPESNGTTMQDHPSVTVMHGSKVGMLSGIPLFKENAATATPDSKSRDKTGY